MSNATTTNPTPTLSKTLHGEIRMVGPIRPAEGMQCRFRGRVVRLARVSGWWMVQETDGTMVGWLT